MHRRTRTLASAALSLTLATSLIACGSDGDDVATDDAASTTVAESTAPTTAPTTDADTTTTVDDASTTIPDDSLEGVDTETSVLDTLPDGVHHGYIAGLETGTVEGQSVQVIIFDPVELLTGDAATQAAIEDGVLGPDEGPIPNDVYVRNEVQTVIRLAVVPEAQVSTLSGGGPDLVPSSVDEVWRQTYLFRIDAQNVRGITTLSSIEAVYLP